MVQSQRQRKGLSYHSPSILSKFIAVSLPVFAKLNEFVIVTVTSPFSSTDNPAVVIAAERDFQLGDTSTQLLLARLE